MSARDCRLLVDLEPLVRALIDQPADDTSQLNFPMSQLVAAANSAHEECFYLASQLCADWCSKEAIVTASAGADWVALPADLYALTRTTEWDTSTSTKKREIACGEWSQLGVRKYDALFKPKDTEHSNQATLRFMKPLTRALTLKVVYDYLPLRLIHGVLPVDAGAVAFQLADYESVEDGTNVGQTLWITADQVGLPLTGGSFGSQAITGWSGKYRLAAFANAWNPVPKRGAQYTCRPDLPRSWERFFVLEWAVQLGLKLQTSVVEQWKAERNRLEVRKKHQAATVDRRAAKLVRFRPVAGRGLTGDPINGPSGLGL